MQQGEIAELHRWSKPGSAFLQRVLGRKRIAGLRKKADKEAKAGKAEKLPRQKSHLPPEDPEVLASRRLIKTLENPFGRPDSQQNETVTTDPLASLSLTPSAAPPRRTSLSDRLLQPTLYLPGHMTIGQTSKFIVKGKPGSYVALAMADKDTGAKPIMGRKIRLGSDRKVVAAGQLPSSGVLTLTIDTPVEGDLIGLCLYSKRPFWQAPDLF